MEANILYSLTRLPFADSEKRLTICIVYNERDRFIKLHLIMLLEILDQ